MGQNITESTQAHIEARATLKKVKKIEYTAETDTNDTYYYATPSDTLWRFFSKDDLENQLDIKNADFDAIINFKDRSVICVQGHNFYEQICYTLDDIKRVKI